MLVGTMRMSGFALIFFLASGLAWAQAHPRDGEIHDADTLRWWHTTEALSGDAMEGRDTGSAAYQRAAEYVEGRFRAAGLLPAGDDGSYFQMADDLKAGAVGHHGLTAVRYSPGGQSDVGSDVIDKGITLVPTKRSILFCAFTGEEKGLLGSSWFVKHPTVPVEELAADINLDQLRPLFPLKILTAEAVNDTTLGQTAREVGKGMGIEIREDREPERGLLRRADQYPFLRIHVPAISFIFGYDPGTDAEKRYREWYEVRYHRPQDDLTQPVDFQAAETFDVFFYRLVETTADAAMRPTILPDSQFAERK